jgi:hypothetical protein
LAAKGYIEIGKNVFWAIFEIRVAPIAIMDQLTQIVSDSDAVATTTIGELM